VALTQCIDTFDAGGGHRSSDGQRSGAPIGLVPLLARLSADCGVRVLPDWSYTVWCRALAYPDVDSRPHHATTDLGRRRDAVLAVTPVADLVEWAGRRRPTEPVAAVAAALCAARAACQSGVGDTVDLVAVARQVARAVDIARPPRAPRRHGPPLVEHPDRLRSPDPDPVRRGNPNFDRAVGALLRMAGTRTDSRCARRVEDAVAVAADWWTTHATPVPGAVDGLALPGVVPAQDLREDQRLSQLVPDATLLGLVAGPRPGRGRPCQVAWRRGMTYWVAARLVCDGAAAHPPVSTIRWWRQQLSDLSADDSTALTPSIQPTGVTAC
jgi:hypothetical protein